MIQRFETANLLYRHRDMFDGPREQDRRRIRTLTSGHVWDSVLLDTASRVTVVMDLYSECVVDQVMGDMLNAGV